MQTDPSVNQIHPAYNPAEIDMLADVLSRTFDQDSHFNWIIRQDRKRSEALRMLFKLILTDIAGTRGEIHATSDLQAAAIWFPPNANKLKLTTQLRVFRRFASICGWENLAVRAYGLNLMESRHPRSPHYFLQTIGVDPAVQRQGHGTALMRTLLLRCDAAGFPAYLETSNPRNIPFYEKHGFQVISESTLPKGPVIFQMLRPWQPQQNRQSG